MPAPTLQLFDLEHLTKELSRKLPNDCEVFLGNYAPRNPRRNPFLYGVQLQRTLTDRKITYMGKRSLILSTPPSGIGSIFDLNRERKIGTIFVEQGEMDPGSAYGGLYEAITLRLKRPLKFTDGITLPPLTRKLYIETEECMGNTLQQVDRERLIGMGPLGIGWKRRDFSKELPTEWFLPQPYLTATERIPFAARSP